MGGRSEYWLEEGGSRGGGAGKDSGGANDRTDVGKVLSLQVDGTPPAPRPTLSEPPLASQIHISSRQQQSSGQEAIGGVRRATSCASCSPLALGQQSSWSAGLDISEAPAVSTTHA